MTTQERIDEAVEHVKRWLSALLGAGQCMSDTRYDERTRRIAAARMIRNANDERLAAQNLTEVLASDAAEEMVI